MKPEISNIASIQTETNGGISGDTLKLSFYKQETIVNESIFPDAYLATEKEGMELELSRLLLIYFKY